MVSFSQGEGGRSKAHSMFTIYILACVLFIRAGYIDHVVCQNFPENGVYDTFTECRSYRKYVSDARVEWWTLTPKFKKMEEMHGYVTRRVISSAFCWRAPVAAVSPTARSTAYSTAQP